MARGFAVHSINPRQLDRFRDRLSPASAKDERRDARTLAAALRTDRHCFRRLEPTDPVIVELRERSRLSENLTRERVRLANRMREQLWRYYPQFLDAVDARSMAEFADSAPGPTCSRGDAKYQVLRARAHGHARALRSVADRRLNVACAMLRDDTCLDRHRARTATT